MAILDIILLLCFVPAIVSGLTKGFVKQVVDFIAILAAAWAAFHFSTILGSWLSQYLSIDPTILNVISFVAIILVAALLLKLVGDLITQALKVLSLGFLNRLLGLVFSVLKVALVLGLLILLVETLDQSMGFLKPGVTDNAVVYNALKDAAGRIFPILRDFVTGDAAVDLSSAVHV